MRQRRCRTRRAQGLQRARAPPHRWMQSIARSASRCVGARSAASARPETRALTLRAQRATFRREDERRRGRRADRRPSATFRDRTPHRLGRGRSSDGPFRQAQRERPSSFPSRPERLRARFDSAWRRGRPRRRFLCGPAPRRVRRVRLFHHRQLQHSVCLRAHFQPPPRTGLYAGVRRDIESNAIFQQIDWSRDDGRAACLVGNGVREERSKCGAVRDRRLAVNLRRSERQRQRNRKVAQDA